MSKAVALRNVDPAAEIYRSLGNISDVEVCSNQILVAVYIRPEKTAGGLILPDATRDEDKYQSKVGLIVKMGPDACLEWRDDAKFSVGDWIVFRVSDGWSLGIKNDAAPSGSSGVICRMLSDDSIRMRISHPERVW
jgi:co-chaperonin GroES (HSP10)